jgi:acyl-ACP thioesterase
MYAEFSETPCWNEKIKIRTWPSGTEKLFAMRTYELSLADGTRIGSGTSSWLIIDWTTKKIQRPDEFLRKYSRENMSIAQPVRNPERLNNHFAEGSEYGPFNVPVSDIDINLHTNNANYIKWVTDTYTLDFILEHRPFSAEINYLAESVAGDKIIIKSARDDESTCFFNHIIMRENDGRELCRMRIGWNNLRQNNH